MSGRRFNAANRVALAFATVIAAVAAAAVGEGALLDPDAARTVPVIRDLRVAALAAPHADDRVPCQNFVMYASQVVRYFQLADELQVGEHHRYMWFPCEARGHLDWDGKRYELRINLGRTAVLRTADGRQRYFGCKAACDGLLLGNRAWDAAGDIED